MPHRTVVLSAPVRTAIGTFGGSSERDAGHGARGDGGPRRDGANQARSRQDRDGGHGQCHPGRQQDEPGAAGGDLWRPAGRGTPAMTVNRVCGSGAQAIASAAQEIMLGMVDCAIAGGMENMDRSALSDGRRRWGYRLGNAEIYDSMLRDGLNDAFSDQHSGWHTEDLVKSRQITREDQDRWAERSQKRFSAAQAAGKFADEIVPVEFASGTSRDFSRRTSTTAPTRRLKASPSCGPPSARTARSPPATRPASTAAPRR